ncbi:hypothetical protein [Marinoscillum pacificum]|uniref:hypothetical protein n=1 Tax=Marinoscillum pacificum TaxID=392723 RepID=UPI002157AEC1|nr:hypothetical protein [Marinoscillum pacificum]
MKYFVLILWIVPLSLFGQTEDEDPKFIVKGYVKDMVTFNFADEDSVLVDNLIHHRLNLAYYPSDNFTAKLEIRNRVFTGDLVKLFPNYGELIDVNNDYFDLSFMPVNRDNLVIHSMIDRAYVQYNKDDWEVTLGRQRLNWGVNLAWNPNDLFNSYSFFDFDYEERPGSDALRVRKYTGYASEIEFAIKAADSFEELTSAIKYQINKWNYDIQFIGGVMQNNLALGTGWAGSIGGMGFKGELTYLDEFGADNSGFLTSISFDYMLPNLLYFNASGLYNSYGLKDPYFGLVNTSSNLDIRSISPYKWSAFLQSAYPVHPLVNVGLATMLFPSDASFFVNPSVTYAIVNNLDLDLIGQFYFSEGNDAKAVYLRAKFSY